MNHLSFYYRVKPLIPRRWQILLRRSRAQHKKKSCQATWPIDPATAKAPAGWLGWPEGKKFALILSHDVDTAKGHERCGRLMKMEERLGFRSAFNFVPEDYRVSEKLRFDLAAAGFEVGVHGLKHDGKLFDSREIFDRNARRINEYIKEWGAVGFHAPSAHHNLDWIGDLNIEYDSSTFDTDPFEPQSDGLGTIFPVWIANESPTRGYVELPYTLAQDHCLFAILKENDIRVWKEKLDWIARNGGMALLNSHPDYMNFGEMPCAMEEYPVGHYQAFLEYIKAEYEGRYWHVLPRDLARFWKAVRPENPRLELSGAKGNLPSLERSRIPQEAAVPGVKIWIDLDNTPHVPFFIPIIRELERRGHLVSLTARDAFQVNELADKKGLSYAKIGRHYGKKKLLKLYGLLWRSAQLLPFYLRQKPGLGLSHGSRSSTLLCNLMRIPSIMIFDYEHARGIPFGRPRWLIAPEALSGAGILRKFNRSRFYRGIKEDVYAPEFKPDPSLLEDLGLRQEDMIVTVRPPASEAHYRNPESDHLLRELMAKIGRIPGLRAVLLPRNRAQEEAFNKSNPEWFVDRKTIVPRRVVDGLDLLWYSDLVISGGGTMNREAAALGIPVYSIFRGKTGAVDRMLEKEGRLILIRTVEEIGTKIQFTRRDKGRLPDHRPRFALEDIVDHIEEIIRLERVRPRRGAKADSP